MVDRNRTNTQHGEALLLGQVAETADAVVRPLFIRRGEQHCHAVVPRPRQREAAERRRSGQKRVRNLEQNTRSVPSVRLIAHAAPVSHALKHIDRPNDQGVALPAVGLHNHANPTGIVLKSRIIQALSLGQGRRLLSG